VHCSYTLHFHDYFNRVNVYFVILFPVSPRFNSHAGPIYRVSPKDRIQGRSADLPDTAPVADPGLARGEHGERAEREPKRGSGGPQRGPGAESF